VQRSPVLTSTASQVCKHGGGITLNGITLKVELVFICVRACLMGMAIIHCYIDGYTKDYSIGALCSFGEPAPSFVMANTAYNDGGVN